MTEKSFCINYLFTAAKNIHALRIGDNPWMLQRLFHRSNLRRAPPQYLLHKISRRFAQVCPHALVECQIATENGGVHLLVGSVRDRPKSMSLTDDPSSADAKSTFSALMSRCT